MAITKDCVSECRCPASSRIDQSDIENRTASQWRMVNSLLLATIVRVALIVVSYGCKVPCGIFVPSMAAGATFGRMIGILVKAMHRCAHWLDVDRG